MKKSVTNKLKEKGFVFEQENNYEHTLVYIKEEGKEPIPSNSKIMLYEIINGLHVNKKYYKIEKAYGHVSDFYDDFVRFKGKPGKLFTEVNVLNNVREFNTIEQMIQYKQMLEPAYVEGVFAVEVSLLMLEEIDTNTLSRDKHKFDYIKGFLDAVSPRDVTAVLLEDKETKEIIDVAGVDKRVILYHLGLYFNTSEYANLRIYYGDSVMVNRPTPLLNIQYESDKQLAMVYGIHDLADDNKDVKWEEPLTGNLEELKTKLKERVGLYQVTIFLLFELDAEHKIFNPIEWDATKLKKDVDYLHSKLLRG